MKTAILSAHKHLGMSTGRRIDGSEVTRYLASTNKARAVVLPWSIRWDVVVVQKPIFAVEEDLRMLSRLGVDRRDITHHSTSTETLIVFGPARGRVEEVQVPIQTRLVQFRMVPRCRENAGRFPRNGAMRSILVDDLIWTCRVFQ